MGITETQEAINRIMKSTRDLLIQKNRQYGDSALNPIGVFGTTDAVVNLGARMDDKLMRLRGQGIGAQSVDTLYDLQGYIALLIIAIERREGIVSTDMVVMDESNTKEIIINGK